MAKGTKHTARKTTGGNATLAPLNPVQPPPPLELLPLPSCDLTVSIPPKSQRMYGGETSARLVDLVSAQNSLSLSCFRPLGSGVPYVAMVESSLNAASVVALIVKRVSPNL